jgi:hypothetical protein
VLSPPFRNMEGQDDSKAFSRLTHCGIGNEDEDKEEVREEFSYMLLRLSIILEETSLDRL